FKLPPANPAVTEQTAISALSTAALAAPTGETATYLRRDQLEASDEAAGASASVNRVATPVAPAVADVRESSSGGGKLGLIIAGIAAAAALIVGGVLLFGGNSEPSTDSPAPQADETVATAQPDKPATVATKPEPAAAEAGTLEITSEPVGELIIDGEPAGTTPYEEPLPIGKHTLEIVA